MPNTLTATEAASRIRDGSLSAQQLMASCLARIETREPVVHAWAHINPGNGASQALSADRNEGSGPLRGIPVGIKDVFDTADMPTEMGSPIYKHHQPPTDASVVALLRKAGAIVLGKTVTAEFAGMAPGDTTNPHSATHTPGGSSSGSAAAVADMMVPIALGTQTGGSVMRPASYCGIFAFKPTFGLVNRAGMKFAAESLDTVGWMARSLPDIALLNQVLAGGPEAVERRPGPLRVAVCATHLWDSGLPETHAAVNNAKARLEARGILVEQFAWPREFVQLSAARETINDYERARAMADEWSRHREQISPQLSESIQRGWKIPAKVHAEASQLAERARLLFDRMAEPFDAVLAPCVTGEAPRGLGHSGPPGLQAIWTLLHVPVVGMPTHRGPSGLPISVQLVAPRYRDDRLLSSAQAIWDLVGPPGTNTTAPTGDAA